MEYNRTYLVSEKLTLLIEAVLNNVREPNINNISLYNSMAGEALLLANYYQQNKNEFYKQQVIVYLNEMMSLIEYADEVEPTHDTGIAGLGWLLCYLKDSGIIEAEYDDYLAEFDEFIETVIPMYIEENIFDLIHGAMGMGLFLLKRRKDAAVKTILYGLDKTSEKSNGEIKWAQGDYYDFSLAHGNAGILHFLGKCFESNVLPELSGKLLQGVIDFFMKNVQNVTQIGSYFPYKYDIQEYSTNKHLPQKSRLAWCYGDLGILYTLYFATNLLGNIRQNELILSMLEQTATRRSLSKNYIIDAGFCHGTSGNGYLYYKLYQLTKKQIFEEAYYFWLDQTLQFGNQVFPEAIAGYVFEGHETDIGSDFELLTGASGVAMFFITSQDNKIINNWDDCFFLS